jgi:hypothetical protein
MLAAMNELLWANPDAGEQDVTHAVAWLQHYGYVRHNLLAEASLVALESFDDSLKRAQALMGLPQTGQLDDATLSKMKQPRCGCPDVMPFAALEARWRKNRLNYFVEGYVSGLSKADQEDLLRLAWKHWEDVADLRLYPVVSKSAADIVISTGQGRSQNFDGPSGTLAWAELPPGDDRPLLMRFDLGEAWVKDGQGIRFLNVACHEFGHLLGLDHSRNPQALMAPYYSPGVSRPLQDDVGRIQGLYGKPATVPVPPPIPIPVPTPLPPGGIPMDLNKIIRDAIEKFLIPALEAQFKGPFGGIIVGIIKSVIFGYLDKLSIVKQPDGTLEIKQIA